MPILSNPRHERFAQELAHGKTATEAYELAGYQPDDSHASRLAGNGRVVGRVSELLAKVVAKTEITIQTLAEEAAELQRQAAAAGQFGPANGALKLKAEFLGLYVARKEDVTPRSAREVDDRLRTLTANGEEDRGTEAPRGTTAH